jgi:hypothetical protein
MYKLIDPDLIRQRIEEWELELFIEIFNIFKESYHKNMEEIAEVVRIRDFKGIKDKVHPLKTNFKYFCDEYSEFIKNTQELENKGDRKESAGLDQLHDYFARHADLAYNELEQFVKEFTK